MATFGTWKKGTLNWVTSSVLCLNILRKLHFVSLPCLLFAGPGFRFFLFFLPGMDYLKISAWCLDLCHLGTPAIYGRCSQVLLDPGVLTHNSILIYLTGMTWKITQFTTTYVFRLLVLGNIHILHHPVWNLNLMQVAQMRVVVPV